ncbi:MAG: hypothetical protein WHT47_03980 [Hydrogenothermaceae bacterium]
MKELIDVFNHLSLLPSLKLESGVYEQILNKKVDELSGYNHIDIEIKNNLKKTVLVLPKLRTLPSELSHLLYDIETICIDIIDHLENSTSHTELIKKTEKARAIMEKIDRVLYTYIAEDPKLYFKYCIVIKDIYNRLGNILERLRETKMAGGGIEN